MQRYAKGQRLAFAERTVLDAAGSFTITVLPKEVWKSNFRQYGQMKSRAGKRQREKRKIRRKKSRRERVRRKKMQMREKVGKSRNTMFFQ